MIWKVAYLAVDEKVGLVGHLWRLFEFVDIEVKAISKMKKYTTHILIQELSIEPHALRERGLISHRDLDFYEEVCRRTICISRRVNAHCFDNLDRGKACGSHWTDDSPKMLFSFKSHAYVLGNDHCGAALCYFKLRLVSLAPMN